MTERTPGSTVELAALPDSAVAHAVVNVIRAVETPSVFNHSIRSYLFARLVAPHLGMAAGRDYDDELLFAACAMHDLGVASDSPRRQRFEVEGADRAADMLTARGVPADAVDMVWQAIALHTSPGIAERRGTLCELVRVGVALDFGGALGVDHLLENISDAQADAIHSAYPRFDMVTSLTDEIVAHAASFAVNAPRYTIPGEFLRERETFGLTRLEHAARNSRWGN